MLSVSGLTLSHGAAVAVRDVSFEVREHEVTVLLGANGAGKTTIMMALSGLLPVRAGDIRLDGHRITGAGNDRLVGLGIVQVPQGRQVFPGMTVRENLELGAFLRRDRNVGTDLDRIFAHFPKLAERTGQTAGTLSGGEQQMLAIGRALMGKPRLLLLDEPSLGLAPVIVDAVYDIVAELVRDGLTILLAEQNVAKALSVAARGFVLENGTVIASGSGAELAATDFVHRAYLGSSDDDLPHDAER
ncbi:ABC transporter ATP-binding protein [Chelatococcus reniformis]|uniref:ABC transporter ATP-binding protein n=1 Tax=Chelatococcus reniformis TaxID=1494448 RepID=A0A916XNI4_9HYPH|nr:ABC transporter ATP-binding protein [Chelatococcus reniformis]GGC89483.1 ABC transporter ATP-binding protein [Chelatococcus reniformis]